MRMSNVIMIAVAIVCAAVAALLSRAWLVSQSARAPAEVASVEAPSKSIVVAVKDLKYGDKITAEAIKQVPWGDNVLPRGAYTSTDAMLKGGSRVVLRDMSQGEPVLAHKLLGGESDNTLPGKLSRNMKAVTIRVNEVAGVAGFVQPEDRVDVFMTYGGDKKTEAGGAAGSAIVVLLQNIRVLAVDQATKRVDQPTPASAVTLEVTTKDAQKLTLAGTGGNLSLALNRLDNGISTENVGTINFDDLLNKGEISSGTSTGRNGPVVTVTRSVERKNYNVPQDNRSDEDWQHEILSHQGNNTAPSQ